MALINSKSKVGIYIDAANMYRNGGSRMQYDVLREFACRDGSEAVRLNAYVTYDLQRAEVDPDYRKKASGFHATLRDFGYKVILKPVKWYEDEHGNRYAKANADLDLAVDAILQSQNLDRVVLATGDGDFVQVVKALQNKGCRVEAVAFDNISPSLRQEADLFVSGYLIPHLSPTDNRTNTWGTIGSTVRGWCYYYDDTRGIGFMRFLRKVAPGLWLIDKRKNPDSPYETAFFHHSMLLGHNSIKYELPSRDLIFEFTLAHGRTQNEFNATDIRLVSGGTSAMSNYQPYGEEEDEEDMSVIDDTEALTMFDL
ncbi:MAG: NYN domain-containing protein [Candidatus Promineifilaceae bacterium]